jgi:hypothetical protein
VAVNITLRGALTANVEALIRARVALMSRSALLRAAGAGSWCADDRVGVAVDDGGARVTVEVPWEAIDALAEVLRGEVRDARDGALGF